MPSRKFQSGLARTLANALFQQYAEEDRAKAEAEKKAFQTSRDIAERLFQEKRDIRSREFETEKQLKRQRYESGEDFRKSQRKARATEKEQLYKAGESEKDRQNRLKYARIMSRGRTKNFFGSGTLAKEEYDALTSLAADHSIGYENAQSKEEADYHKKEYQKYAKTLRDNGYPFPQDLTDILGRFQGNVEEVEAPGPIKKAWDFMTSREVYDPSKAPGFNFGQQVKSLFGGGETQNETVPQGQGQYEDGDILQFDDGSFGIVRNGIVEPITMEELQQLLNQ